APPSPAAARHHLPARRPRRARGRRGGDRRHRAERGGGDARQRGIHLGPVWRRPVRRRVVLHRAVHHRVPAAAVDLAPAAGVRAQLLRRGGPALGAAHLAEHLVSRGAVPGGASRPAGAARVPHPQAGGVRGAGRRALGRAAGQPLQDHRVRYRGGDAVGDRGLHDVPGRRP
ncbi:MAG: Potassium voltage-gated channel subfamily KQT; possible potassium channel, VIC family, partial [uncultured Gemmatimonadetes bacterium]